VAIVEGISVALPAGLVPVGTAGADSVVREYLSESLQLSIDYGWYGDSLTGAEGEGLVRRAIGADGWTALLVTYRDAVTSIGLPYVAALHVPDLGRGTVELTLVARGSSEDDQKRAVRILRSLRFDERLR